MEDFSFMQEIVSVQMKFWKKKHFKIDDSGNRMIPLEIIRKENNPSSFLSLLLYTEGIKGIDCRKLLNAETAGKLFHSDDYTILRDRAFLILQKKDRPSLESYKISELPAQIEIENMAVSITTAKNINADIYTGNKNIFLLDAEKATLPLTLRPWESGDYFFPLGMNGKKKISDFYTDEKINRFQKDKIYLLLSGKDIVCILGHRIDERYKITSSTTNILTIEITPA